MMLTRARQSPSGVVVWAVYSQAESFAGISGDEVVASIKADPLARHDIPDWVDAVARGVIERCWEADASARPTFHVVSETLRAHYCSSGIGGIAAEVYCDL